MCVLKELGVEVSGEMKRLKGRHRIQLGWRDDFAAVPNPGYLLSPRTTEPFGYRHAEGLALSWQGQQKLLISVWFRSSTCDGLSCVNLAGAHDSLVSG